jgi:hypothetical protein
VVLGSAQRAAELHGLGSNAELNFLIVQPRRRVGHRLLLQSPDPSSSPRRAAPLRQELLPCSPVDAGGLAADGGSCGDGARTHTGHPSLPSSTRTARPGGGSSLATPVSTCSSPASSKEPVVAIQGVAAEERDPADDIIEHSKGGRVELARVTSQIFPEW